MEQASIEEIRMVAKFMGINTSLFGRLVYRCDEEDGMIDFTGGDEAYMPDISWNDLMPVVEKIESIQSLKPGLYLNVRISQGYIEIEGAPTVKIHYNASIEGSKIKALWKAVVHFIKFYNLYQAQP